MAIAAFDTDDLADNNGKAKITWISSDCLPECMFYSAPALDYGWINSELRAHLRNDIFPMIPSNIRNNIKEVSKAYTYYTASGNSKNVGTCIDTIWTPSLYELCETLFSPTGSTTNAACENIGPVYSELFPAYGNRAKLIYCVDTPGYALWYTRSVSGRSNVVHISSTGQSATGALNTARKVVIGFCT